VIVPTSLGIENLTFRRWLLYSRNSNLNEYFSISDVQTTTPHNFIKIREVIAMIFFKSKNMRNKTSLDDLTQGTPNKERIRQCANIQQGRDFPPGQSCQQACEVWKACPVPRHLQRLQKPPRAETGETAQRSAPCLLWNYTERSVVSPLVALSLQETIFVMFLQEIRIHKEKSLF
jgi:hypothetical protein